MVNRYYSTTAAQAQLTSNISSSATTINIDTTVGWPSSFPFTLVIDPNTASEEVVECTGVAGLSATVIRGCDGSTGLAHTTGAKVQHGVSARDFAEPQSHMATSTGVHGLAGGVAVVGTSTAQSLTNKTIDGSSNTVTNLPNSAVPGFASHLTDTDVHHRIVAHDTVSSALSTELPASSSATDIQTWKNNGVTTAEVQADGTAVLAGGLLVGAGPYARVAKNSGDATTNLATLLLKAANTAQPILRVDGTGQATGGDLLRLIATGGGASVVDKDGNVTIFGTLTATNQATSLKSLSTTTTAAIGTDLTVTGNFAGSPASWYYAPPRCRLRNTVGTTIADGGTAGWVDATWDTEDSDSDNMHSGSGATVTTARNGIWRLVAYWPLVGTANNGWCGLRILAGSTVLASDGKLSGNTSTPVPLMCTAEDYLASGTVLKVQVEQFNLGAARGQEPTLGQPRFTVTFVGTPST